MDKQTKISEAQNRIGVAQERPWVRQQIASVDDMVITEKSLQFGFTVQYINTGNSPAIHVGGAANVVPTIRPPDNATSLQCTFAEAAMGISAAAPTIFPTKDNDPPASGHFTFNMAANSMDIDWNKIVPAGQPPTTDRRINIMPDIVGCIAYRAYIDDLIHHTRFAVSISKKAASDHELIVQTGAPQTISGADIFLRYSVTGINDAD
jgi:hypothetical protein